MSLFKSNKKYQNIQVAAARDLVGGMTRRAIARKYGVHFNTVTNWLKTGDMGEEVVRLRQLVRRLG